LKVERERERESQFNRAGGSEFQINQSIKQSNYFIVHPKVDQRAGQLSLPHLEITKTEKIELKHKTDEQISPVNSLEP